MGPVALGILGREGHRVHVGLGRELVTMINSVYECKLTQAWSGTAQQALGGQWSREPRGPWGPGAGGKRVSSQISVVTKNKKCVSVVSKTFPKIKFMETGMEMPGIVTMKRNQLN